MKGLPGNLQFRLRFVSAGRAVLEIEEEQYEIVYSQNLKPGKQIRKPPRVSPRKPTTRRQLESVTEPVDLEDSVADLMQFLKLTQPSLAAELELLLDQPPVPQPASNEDNEVDPPATQPDD